MMNRAYQKQFFLKTASVILVIASVRFLLFGNIPAWKCYTTLSPDAEEITKFQRELIEEDLLTLKRKGRVENIAYLVIGNSQVRHIFDHEAFYQLNGKIFSLRGIPPWEYFVLEKYFRNRNIDTIILYLSMASTAFPPNLFRLQRFQPSGFKLLQLYIHLFPFRVIIPDFHATMFAAWFGRIFPEYNYNFIFQGFLKKWTHFPVAEKINVADSLFSQKGEWESRSAKYLKSEKYIEFNINFLERFIKDLMPDKKFIIIEGQNHPRIENSTTNLLDEKLSKELEGLAEKYLNVSFVPKSRLYQFTEEDFAPKVGPLGIAAKVLHYSRTAGKKFLDQLLPIIEEIETEWTIY